MTVRLEDLALFGNCQFSALVERSGAVVWCCLPRFDSEPVFSRLLDHELGGQFLIGPADGGMGQQRYLDNTNVVETTFKTEDGSFRVIEYQLPLTNGVIDFQVCGCLQYDVKKKVFSRFDMVAYGDVASLRKDVIQPPRGRTLAAGLLFELSPGATPWERTPPGRLAFGGMGPYFEAGQ